jgi:hypothetical protein
MTRYRSNHVLSSLLAVGDHPKAMLNKQCADNVQITWKVRELILHQFTAKNAGAMDTLNLRKQRPERRHSHAPEASLRYDI